MITAYYDGLQFVLPDADNCFHKKIGNYVREIPEALRRLRTPPRGTLVVVGACFGATVIGGLRYGGFDRVIAFEPDPNNAEILKVNLLLNKLYDRVRIIEKAAGSVPGIAKMTRCSDANIGGHLVHLGADPRGNTEVPVTTVDDVVQHLGATDVGLVWCDAQGSEPHVLAGARSLLLGNIPWGIELAPGLMKHTPASSYCDPLRVFDRVVDLRTQEASDINQLPMLYKKYLETKSPNNPNKSWHTQLFLYRE